MSLRVGLIQLAVGSCKKTNLNAAAGLIQKAKQQHVWQCAAPTTHIHAQLSARTHTHNS